MPQSVLLVHGLLNSDYWLTVLSRRLRAEGFGTALFGYGSVFGGPEKAVARLRTRLQSERFDALVGHSLGGLVALEAVNQAPDSMVSRIVCLGTPLRGSETARRIAARAWSRPLLGRSAGLLQAGRDASGGTVQVGMVAGDVPWGLGRLFHRFDATSDGTVGLDETRMPWLTDHCIVHSSHSGLVFSAEAAGQAAHFIREGRFRPANPTASTPAG
jgi:pimeloyl-ACP methyl ester carboxylesterase